MNEIRAYVEKYQGDLASLYWQKVEYRGETPLVYEYSLLGRRVFFSKKWKRFICEANEQCLLNSSAKEYWNCWHTKTVARAIRERKSFKWERQETLK